MAHSLRLEADEDLWMRTPSASPRSDGKGRDLSGWTLDFDTSNPLETDVYEDTCCTNPRGAFTANVSRPDVAAALPGSSDTHGVRDRHWRRAPIYNDENRARYLADRFMAPFRADRTQRPDAPGPRSSRLRTP